MTTGSGAPSSELPRNLPRTEPKPGIIAKHLPDTGIRGLLRQIIDHRSRGKSLEKIVEHNRPENIQDRLRQRFGESDIDYTRRQETQRQKDLERARQTGMSAAVFDKSGKDTKLLTKLESDLTPDEQRLKRTVENVEIALSREIAEGTHGLKRGERGQLVGELRPTVIVRPVDSGGYRISAIVLHGREFQVNITDKGEITLMSGKIPLDASWSELRLPTGFTQADFYYHPGTTDQKYPNGGTVGERLTTWGAKEESDSPRNLLEAKVLPGTKNAARVQEAMIVANVQDQVRTQARSSVAIPVEVAGRIYSYRFEPSKPGISFSQRVNQVWGTAYAKARNGEVPKSGYAYVVEGQTSEVHAPSVREVEQQMDIYTAPNGERVLALRVDPRLKAIYESELTATQQMTLIRDIMRHREMPDDPQHPITIRLVDSSGKPPSDLTLELREAIELSERRRQWEESIRGGDTDLTKLPRGAETDAAAILFAADPAQNRSIIYVDLQLRNLFAAVASNPSLTTIEAKADYVRKKLGIEYKVTDHPDRQAYIDRAVQLIYGIEEARVVFDRVKALTREPGETREKFAERVRGEYAQIFGEESGDYVKQIDRLVAIRMSELALTEEDKVQITGEAATALQQATKGVPKESRRAVAEKHIKTRFEGENVYADPNERKIWDDMLESLYPKRAADMTLGELINDPEALANLMTVRENSGTITALRAAELIPLTAEQVAAKEASKKAQEDKDERGRELAEIREHEVRLAQIAAGGSRAVQDAQEVARSASQQVEQLAAQMATMIQAINQLVARVEQLSVRTPDAIIGAAEQVANGDHANAPVSSVENS